MYCMYIFTRWLKNLWDNLHTQFGSEPIAFSVVDLYACAWYWESNPLFSPAFQMVDGWFRFEQNIQALCVVLLPKLFIAEQKYRPEIVNRWKAKLREDALRRKKKVCAAADTTDRWQMLNHKHVGEKWLGYLTAEGGN